MYSSKCRSSLHARSNKHAHTYDNTQTQISYTLTQANSALQPNPLLHPIPTTSYSLKSHCSQPHQSDTTSLLHHSPTEQKWVDPVTRQRVSPKPHSPNRISQSKTVLGLQNTNPGWRKRLVDAVYRRESVRNHWTVAMIAPLSRKRMPGLLQMQRTEKIWCTQMGLWQTWDARGEESNWGTESS